MEQLSSHQLGILLSAGLVWLARPCKRFMCRTGVSSNSLSEPRASRLGATRPPRASSPPHFGSPSPCRSSWTSTVRESSRRSTTTQSCRAGSRPSCVTPPSCPSSSSHLLARRPPADALEGPLRAGTWRFPAHALLRPVRRRQEDAHHGHPAGALRSGRREGAWLPVPLWPTSGAHVGILDGLLGVDEPTHALSLRPADPHRAAHLPDAFEAQARRQHCPVQLPHRAHAQVRPARRPSEE